MVYKIWLYFNSQVIEHLMKFNKNKYVGKHNPGVRHWLRFTRLESSSVKRDIGMQANIKLNSVSSVLLLWQRSQENAALQHNNVNIYETRWNSRIILYIMLIKRNMDLLKVSHISCEFIYFLPGISALLSVTAALEDPPGFN